MIKSIPLGCLVILVCTFDLGALTIEGTGYGQTQEIARNLALQEIGFQMEVQVQSTTTGRQVMINNASGNRYEESIVVDLQTRVDLPLLGVTFVELPRQRTGEFGYTATLDSGKSIELYLTKINELNTSLVSAETRQKTLTGPTREQALQDIVTQIRLFEKYQTVLIALGHSPIPALSVDKNGILANLRNLQATMDTMDKAAEYLTRGITQSGIYVYPPTARNSSEVTPFGAVFRDKIRTRIRAVESPDQATFALKGTYEAGPRGLELSYNLIQIKGAEVGRIVLSAQTPLLLEALGGLQWEPKALGLDRLIQDGVVLSGDFRMEVSTNRGRSDLLFVRGETAEILVKLNQPGWFYVVSHIDTSGSLFSYLLELQPEAQGNRKFIYYIGADDVNRWVSLGSFTITPPYGVERLQFFAFSQDPIQSVPANRFNQSSGYHMLGGSQEQNVIQTRGLQRQTSNVVKKTEANITLTTTP